MITATEAEIQSGTNVPIRVQKYVESQIREAVNAKESRAVLDSSTLHSRGVDMAMRSVMRWLTGYGYQVETRQKDGRMSLIIRWNTNASEDEEVEPEFFEAIIPNVFNPESPESTTTRTGKR